MDYEKLIAECSENDLRVAVRIAWALCETGRKPNYGKPIEPAPGEAEQRRRNILEDAPKYAPK